MKLIVARQAFNFILPGITQRRHGQPISDTWYQVFLYSRPVTPVVQVVNLEFYLLVRVLGSSPRWVGL